ncbi:phosphoadenosine phosphosulfate reductase family protein [Aurantimonas coralicida]|uniref:phosphoadenosine phosphosulfate reductase domain-containing protein n=1 Tax=Aurantimonas coralicida TaxID=182270 RepID=UPI001E578338|nr:phosphoadenosine phosphosulfate reductase family protein [Aurantimonas coralicida]
MANPYRIEGPALISFSGGRTSAFMLWNIIQAHGGTLPDDVVVAFANTGKEREETLRFVYECGSRWGVKIHWLEWRPPATFEEVGFNSAARDGEPFEEMIRRKQYLPNATMRYCTTELKIRTMRNFMQSLGHKKWMNAVGLRYDEGHRVLKSLARNDANKDPFKAVMPMAKAKHSKRDVMSFWLGPSRRFPSDDLPQGFDLGLHDFEGNCDLCFLKGRDKLAAVIRDDPSRADWWIRMEEAAKCSMPAGARFKKVESFRDLAAFVRDQGELPLPSDDEEYDVECGLTCEDAA